MSSPSRVRATRLSWFVDRGVNTKIVAAVLLAVSVGVLVGLVGIMAQSQTASAAQGLYDDNVLGLEHATTMRTATVEMRLNVTNHGIAANDAELAKFADAAVGAEADARGALAAYRDGVVSPDHEVALTDFESGLDQYVAIRDAKMFPAGEHGDLAAWRQARDDASAPIATIMDSTAQLVQLETALAETAADGARTTSDSSRVQVLALLAVGLVVSVGLGIAVARGIVSGLKRVQVTCDALAAGDLTTTVGLSTKDEVGRMGRALDAALTNLRRVIGTIDESATSLAGASEQMSTTATQIASTAEETSSQAGVVSAAAEHVSRNVQTVAAGSEQMRVSIREIATNASQAAEVARGAVAEAADASATVNRLGESSKEIGNVVKLINTIAEQTNLLALNATIEAARAGEAGKGFAVVAGEVKELAQQTAKATDDIARRVDAIQSDTAGAVGAIERITGIIGSINDFQTTIASAVEEQTATTAEINRNVSDAATGSGEIAANVAGLASAADLTTQGVNETQQAVASLTIMSSELRELVSQFTVESRTTRS